MSDQQNSNARSQPLGPQKLFSLSGSISYEDNLPAKAKLTLSQKERKESAVQNLHQQVTEASRYLVNAGIKEKDITSWMFEPWKYKSITDASKWWDKYMAEAVRELIYILNNRTSDGWRLLAASMPKHSDFTALRAAQSKIRGVWFKRPRWKDERGRVQEEGY